jgi:predicted metal-dependent RNase
LHYKDIVKKISEIMPPDCEVTKVEPEGLSTVIYIKNIRSFYTNERLIKELASALKKKVTIRVDPSALMKVDETKATIEALVPKEADVKGIVFVPEMCEVHIEAIKPGLVIGKGGSTLKEIMLRTGWAPITVRAPTMPSATLDGVRKISVMEAAERKKFLVSIGKKICQPAPAGDWIRVMALGGFREVGRSCLLVQTPHSKVLIDVGVNPATGDPTKAYPYLNLTGFSLSDQDGKTVKLSDFKGRKVLLYFYPKADTPGCTTQSCAVRDARQDMKKLNVAVLGLSPDAPADQKKFDVKFTLGFPLLADTDHAVAEAYGVWGEKTSYGKTSMGIIP